MTGGNRKRSRGRCARIIATGMLGGLVFVVPKISSVADELPDVLPVTASGPQALTRADERSIIIESGKSPAVDPDVALVTDQSEDALEPIASTDEYGVEPELAEDNGPVPTLADPPEPAEDEAPSYIAADDEPSLVTPSARPGGTSSISDQDGGDAEFVIADDLGPESVFQTASFNGVVPGESTREDVLSDWGSPLEKQTNGKTLTYDVEGFRAVSLTFSRDRVAAIRIELAEATPAADLAKKLALTGFRPAYVKDDDGNVVSTIYPERGVTFGHAPALGAAIASDDDVKGHANGSETVHELVMRPIEATAFIRRAEHSPSTSYANRIADLEAALDLGQDDSRARNELSRAKLAIGQALAAEALAADVVEREASNDDYRLQWANSLRALGRYDEAVRETRTILEGTTASQIVRADALETMARLATVGPAAERARAIALHNKAIELADKLAASDDAAIRTRAHRILLDAHLGMAERIAAGGFQNKDRSVEEWMTRASALAEHIIAEGEADVSLRVMVSVSALTAGGRLSPPVDPALWVAEAQQAAAEAEPQLIDQKARDNVHWQLGLAYSLAAEIQHRRGEADLAISYGELADANLTPLREARSELADTDVALGRAYFQIGAAYAVHKQDHDEACQWYDRAAGLLLAATPAAIASPGQHGDALVSMGVSYWEVGQRDRAYELTKAGSELIEQGVNEGLLAESSLAVPQGNLNAMALALGKIQPSAPVDDIGPTRTSPNRRMGGQQQTSRAKTNSRMAGRSNPNDAIRRR